MALPILLDQFKDDQPLPEGCEDAVFEHLFPPDTKWNCTDGLKVLYETYCKKRNALLKDYYNKPLLIIARDDGSKAAIVAVGTQVDYLYYEAAWQMAIDQSKIKVYCVVTPGKRNTIDLRERPQPREGQHYQLARASQPKDEEQKAHLQSSPSSPLVSS